MKAKISKKANVPDSSAIGTPQAEIVKAVVPQAEPILAEPVSAKPVEVRVVERGKKERFRLSREDRLNFLDKILARDFPPAKIAQLVKDLTEADDVRSTSGGKFYKAPNWEVRDKGLNKVLRLQGILTAEDATLEGRPPAKVVFQVIQTQINKADPATDIIRNDSSPEDRG